MPTFKTGWNEIVIDGGQLEDWWRIKFVQSYGRGREVIAKSLEEEQFLHPIKTQRILGSRSTN